MYACVHVCVYVCMVKYGFVWLGVLCAFERLCIVKCGCVQLFVNSYVWECV